MRGPDEVAIFVLRHDRSEVLVVHRSPDLGGYWHTIAGGVEAGEALPDAAARELLEETALRVAVHETGIAFHYPLTEEPPERRARYAPDITAVRVSCFVADAPDGWEPTLDHEHDDYRWVAADDAPDALFWPDVADALRRSLA
jgi:8-oxo-dGTP pyrophosphatase MutT (NUDIX family)